MRITLVISSLAVGGAERVMSIIANHWGRHGHDVTLLTFDSGSEPPAYALDPRIQHVALGLAGNSPHAPAAVWNNLRRVFKLRSAIRKSEPDCVISFLDQTNVLTLLATAGCGFPVVVSEHVDPHSHPLGRPWRWLRNFLYERADAVHVLTGVMLSRFPPSVRARGRVIPNPVLLCEPVADERPGEPVGRPILSVGRLTRQKGFDILLAAFVEVSRRHASCNLTILGDGPLRQELEALRDRLGIADRVELPGQVNNIASYLRRAELFVMASRYEGFPMALCEAMACGLPVISTDCPSGPREIIRDGVDGILVRNGDVEALARAIDRLMSDEEERKRLGAEAVMVTERFGVQRVMGMWEDLLDEVLRAQPDDRFNDDLK
jgi:glycosyltransferase involved in cell wall biosynthesis